MTSRWNSWWKSPRTQKVFYGFGHILNDLSLFYWLSYRLLYMTKVVGLTNTNAGIVQMLGFVLNGISNPFIAYLCDKTYHRKYGGRKTWHAIGCVTVLITFPFLFHECVNCEDSSETYKFVYYSFFATVFNIGWATVQITHLSLIPALATKPSQRVELNSIRTAVTSLSGIFFFTMTWLLLGTSSGGVISRETETQFSHLTFIVIGTGFVFVSVFGLGVIEPRFSDTTKKMSVANLKKAADAYDNAAYEKDKNDNQECINGKEEASSPSSITSVASQTYITMTWKDWFKNSNFYKVALIVLFTRILINVFQSYNALYLTDTLAFNKEAVAYFPLLVLVSGIVGSILVKPLTKRISVKYTFVLSGIVATAGCAGLYFIPKEANKGAYPALSAAGLGGTMMLVVSLTMTANLIGPHKSSAAFIYGLMGLVDKISSGSITAVIQAFMPTKNNSLSYCKECADYIRLITGGVTAITACFAMITAFLIYPKQGIQYNIDLIPAENNAQSSIQERMTEEETEVECYNDVRCDIEVISNDQEKKQSAVNHGMDHDTINSIPQESTCAEIKDVPVNEATAGLTQTEGTPQKHPSLPYTPSGIISDELPPGSLEVSKP